MTAADAASPAETGPGREDMWRLLGALGGILTVVTAVMFYFGWRRSEAQAQAMGIDVSLFGFSAQDYVLRSISSLYLPLLALFALGLGWLWGHARLTRSLRGDAAAEPGRRARLTRWTRRTAVVAGTVAALCLLFTMLAGSPDAPVPVGWLATRLQDRQWLVPLGLVVATLVTTYAVWVGWRLQPASTRGGGDAWPRAIAAALVVGVGVLGLLWVMEEYASVVGRGYAQQVARNVDRLPQASVISTVPLGIDAPGVVERQLDSGPGGPPLYRTTGLRLLARTEATILLLHDGWTPDTGTVVVVRDDDNLTWQFAASTAATPAPGR